MFAKQADGTIIELSTNPTDLDAATLRIDGVEITASATELNSLDGLTATTAELNILDGVTATATELNKLDGFTGSTAELNLLDGLTASTTELNYVDGVTSSIQTQLDNKADDTTSPTLTLDGDVSGSATLTNLGDATLTVTVADDSHNHTIANVDGLQTALDGKATTAQGALADSAVQPNDNVSFGTGDFSGNVDVTGTVTADGLTVGDANRVDVDDNEINVYNSNYYIASVNINDSDNTNGLTLESGFNGDILFKGYNGFTSSTKGGGTKRLFIEGTTGDIQFYEDTGTTAKMVWDASAESLNVGGNINYGYGINVGDDGYGINSTGVAPIVMRGTEYRLQGVNPSPMTFYTSNSERMRIDSAGNVGIGGAPSEKLVVNGGTVYPKVKIHASSNTSRFMRLGMDSATDMSVEANGAGTNLLFKTVGSERARIDSSGNLLIGTTTNPTSSKFRAYGISEIDGNGVSLLRLKSSGVQIGTLGQSNYVATGAPSTGVGIQSAADLVFASGGTTERARIDSSGNLLVGKTSALIQNTGLEARSDGLTQITRDGNKPLALNRLTSDGAIAEFYKNSSIVGSIGTTSGALYTANGDTGLGFIGTYDEIFPCNGSGANRDAAINLGGPTIRFKDLYLSGGVFLGGTGAANKLDDYEEGVWTPVLGSSGGGQSVTYGSVREGRYVKVGGLIHLDMVVSWTAFSGGSGAVRIFGIPFNTGSARAVGNAGYVAGINIQNSLIANSSTGLSYFDLREMPVGTGSSPAITTSQMSSSGELQLSITFYTNS